LDEPAPREGIRVERGVSPLKPARVSDPGTTRTAT
jgi:hypothetical protein